MFQKGPTWAVLEEDQDEQDRMGGCSVPVGEIGLMRKIQARVCVLRVSRCPPDLTVKGQHLVLRVLSYQPPH